MAHENIRRAVFLSAALTLLSMAAGAHELSCKLTLAEFRGPVAPTSSTVLTVNHYPVLIQLDYTVINDIADKGSTALAVLLWEFPYPFNPPVPFTVPPGGSLHTATTGLLTSREQCLLLNRPREIGEESISVDFTGHVFFDGGQSLCTARLNCGFEIQPPDAGTPPPDGGTCANPPCVILN